jgi:hypothetical protein
MRNPARVALQHLRRCERENEAAGQRLVDARERLDLALSDCGWHRLSGLLASPLYSDGADAGDLSTVLRRLGVGSL